VLLLLAEKQSYRQIGSAALASPTLIAAVKHDFQTGGVARVLGTQRRTVSVPYWLIVVMRWLLSFTPRDFGFFRSRWSCELLALLLREREGIRLSPETVRRGLHRMEFVWRRPRPIVGPRDPEHSQKLRQLQRFIGQLPDDETVVFQDEMDVHPNPKIGSCWMVRGEQAEIVTPGNNEKRHLAGSLHWRTGRLLLSAPARRRNAALFVAHLDDLRKQSAASCNIPPDRPVVATLPERNRNRSVRDRRNPRQVARLNRRIPRHRRAARSLHGWRRLLPVTAVRPCFVTHSAQCASSFDAVSYERWQQIFHRS
jgi:hypothetical protein